VSGHGRHAVCAYGGADVYMDHAKGDAAREHIDVEGRVEQRREHICRASELFSGGENQGINEQYSVIDI